MNLEVEGLAYAIVGGSSGIGLACGEVLAAEGADLVLVGRDAGRLADAAASVSGGPGRVSVLPLDVTRGDAGRRLAREAEAALGGLDGLVIAAGSMRIRDLDDLTDEEWREQWELSVIAPRRLMEDCAPLLAARGQGSIVNVCSSAGRRPSSRNAAYAVAKRGELALTQVYAELLAPQGIRVNAVAPGPTATPMWLDPGGLLDETARLNGESRDDALAGLAQALPRGRLGRAEEVAASIVALLSPASATSGGVLAVDGGHVADVFP